ncbi:phosphatidate cytidylyltransferase [Pseudoclavibacter chungangensis]|uniref:Phosphatidate cytidylyltransferase n=1 Tax=Pseudoclavibacter chungangensis TaxID=587635 RepID=A0A7J5BZI8_9MICO|nr:phosphatidate cytidylyltransferase [Pseudoclavibacter chungangensis]KAB1659565.1 phosphatidate cytidylyltransferase [Pseudoclavibacter chungangensis]NYJ67385.1 phosphatidate cytidylyltransferase [Pseudoclavibacter chungangensis]
MSPDAEPGARPDRPDDPDEPVRRTPDEVPTDTSDRLQRIEQQARLAGNEVRAQVRAGRRRIKAKSDEINARSGRNLVFAILIGVVLGGALLLSLLFIKQLFILFGVAMVGFVCLELSNAMRSTGRHVPRVPTLAVAIVIVPASYYFGPAGQWISLVAGILFLTAWCIVRASLRSEPPPRADVWNDVLASAFVQLYVTFLGSFTVMLAAQERGEFWVLGFLLVVISIDTSAYVFGLNFGKHKMVPRISPSKTWEGLAGAALTSLVVSVAVSVFLFDMPWWFGLVVGPVLLVTATAGDLTESMVKRDLQIKDISSWLPGHGGFFDRLDSILPSGAMAFALYFWGASLTLH